MLRLPIVGVDALAALGEAAAADSDADGEAT